MKTTSNPLGPLRGRFLGLGCLPWTLISAGLLMALVTCSFAANGFETFRSGGSEPTFTPTKTLVAPAPAVIPAATSTPLPPTTIPLATPIADPPTPAPIVLEPTATAATETRSEAVVGEPSGPGPTINAETANLRGGPGTEYPTVGAMAQGQVVELIGRNEAGDWVQLTAPDGHPAWLATFLIDNVPGNLPIISAPAPVVAAPVDTPAPVVAAPVEAPTAAPAEVVAPTPEPARAEEVVVPVAPVAAVCDCSGDNLNCGNFSLHQDAQACLAYCVATVGFDINGLDGTDGDGNACESLP